MNRHSSILLFLFFLQAIALSINTPANEVIDWQYNEAYFLSLRRSEGSTVGDKISYTTLEALTFLYNYQQFWPFLDLRYHGFGESRQNAANLGLGFRTIPGFTDFILGANVYYDFRKVHNRPFNQIGIGLEMLGSLWNFRINGYLPVGKKTFYCSSKLAALYSRGYFLIREKFADSLRGVDFEAEAMLMKICCTDIYLAIGGYYYQGKTKCRGNILGSEYRLTVKPCNYVTFGLNATHDNVFKTRIQGQIDFTFPFQRIGRFETDPVLFQPIRRREMIVLDKHHMWIWNW